MLRIFIGPVEIAGVAVKIQASLLRLGHKVEAIDLSAHPFCYSRDNSSNGVLVAMQKISNFFLCNSFLNKYAKFLHLSRIVKFCTFVYALFRYDVFVYISHHTYLPWQLDLKILTWMNKKNIFMFLGSDCRPPVINGSVYSNFYKSDTVDIVSLVNMTKSKKAILVRIQKYADIIISSPLYSQSLTRKCANWFHLGFPVEIKRFNPEIFSLNNSIRILHAPSNRLCKGSENVCRVISNLRSEGFPIEFQQIENRPNSEVIAAIANSHIIIDQLYSDTGLSGFSSEAAAMGRVVVVGGYSWEELKKWLHPNMAFPCIQTTEESLEEDLRMLCRNPQTLISQGEACVEFVNSFWNADKHAAILTDWIVNGVSEKSLFDPRDVDYIYGVGAHKSTVLTVLSMALKSVTLEQLGIIHPSAQDACMRLIRDQNFN